MRSVISGKIYDTKTATEICQLVCPYYRSDFGWHCTHLYRSPKGRFFLAGEGYAASMWATHHSDGGRSSGSGMRVIDRDEARSICEDAGLTPEVIAKYFEIEIG